MTMLTLGARSRALILTQAVAALFACRDYSIAQRARTSRVQQKYGFIVIGPSARAYGFEQDTLVELRPEEVPPLLRQAARRASPAEKSSSPEAFNCTRYFGDQAPYVVLFVFECTPATDNTLVVAFDTDAVYGFRGREYDPKLPFGVIQPTWRDRQGRGYYLSDTLLAK